MLWVCICYEKRLTNKWTQLGANSFGEETVRKNYHMVKWEHVCLPKDFGGLGIINTRLMNESLLLKWVWRILQNSKDDKCCQLLRAKYLKRKPFMQCREGVGSQFWKGINKIKHSISWGISYSVNNGRNTRFWEDVWALEVPPQTEMASPI